MDVETLIGPALRMHLPDLARLRIAVFREWPYLYDGDEANEREYLAEFAASPGAALVVAREDGVVVGCSTCVPAADDAVLVPPLVARSVDPAETFYFGESVLLPAYRGRGAGVRFFDAREAHARSFAWCRRAFFSAVRRPVDHPLHPPGHVPLDAFWAHRGFRPWPGPPMVFAWQQVDGPDKVSNELDLWVKEFA